ncbi:MAG: DNA polymerase/3'-5' exonuclease PolX [Gemmataceae bacterium]
MTNDQIAAALEEVGTLLDLRGENPFRANAYHAGARTVEQLSEPVAALAAEGKLAGVRGIGETLREAITALVVDGHWDTLDELRAATPPGLLEMLKLPGLGPKKVKALADAGIPDVQALEAACKAGTVATLKGFGAKTQQKILDGIAFLATAGTRVRIDVASQIADRVVATLRKVKGVQRVEACGSLRRRKETIGDLDFLACGANKTAIMDAFAGVDGVSQVLNRGDTLMSVMLARGEGVHRTELRADLRVVAPEQFAHALHHFTGSKAHNVTMRGRAKDRGYKINEYELLGPKGPVPCKDESAFFTALGLDYIPPELREDTGEIAAAEKHTLPKLVDVKDIKGVFHNHTRASDGTATLAEMADAAQALGFQYLGIADHSQSLVVANGLTPARVRHQHREIDELNDTFDGFRIFKGTESDILPDGSIDFSDDVLATFDYVVASVHTSFGLSREDQTARIIKAVRHPKVTMLGHSTGRLLLQREGYAVDLDAVLKAAADAGTMVEINAQPKRLDLDWVHARRAKDLGITLVINPDAHSTDELEMYVYGVDVARRAWLEKKDVFNTQTLAQVSKTLGV